jgi:hypothetical protein
MGVAGAEPKVAEPAETVEAAPDATPETKPQPAKRAAAAKSGPAAAKPKATKAGSTKTR